MRDPQPKSLPLGALSLEILIVLLAIPTVPVVWLL